MQTKKMSLANIQGRMSRAEMKGINGGTVPVDDSGSGVMYCCVHDSSWHWVDCANVYPSDAQSYASTMGAGYKWCCSSCGSSYTAATGQQWVTT